MKRITPTPNEHHWPRSAVPTIDCRKRDLIIRIADWSRESIQTGEPACDVECYIGGVYDWHESKSCTIHEYHTKDAAKKAAIAFAQAQIQKLL
jgi:hypothetical protein